MGLVLVDFDKEVLEKSWNWLNDEEIKYLTQTPNFTKEQQLKWFENISKTSNYFVKGLAFGKEVIGVVGLKNIDLKEGQAEYFGYIGEKQYWGKGLSSQIFDLIIEVCKQKEIKLLYLNVISENIRAIRAYEKVGFTKKGTEGNVLQMTKKI